MMLLRVPMVVVRPIALSLPSSWRSLSRNGHELSLLYGAPVAATRHNPRITHALPPTHRCPRVRDFRYPMLVIRV